MRAKSAAPDKVRPIRPEVDLVEDPRARQLLEFCGHTLIECMEDAGPLAGAVLVVFGADGSMHLSSDVGELPVASSYALAAVVCSTRAHRVLEDGPLSDEAPAA